MACFRHLRSVVALLAACSIWVGGAATLYAQAPATAPAPGGTSTTATQLPTPPRTPENASPAAQAQRAAVQPFNNAPVWRQVRSNTPGSTTTTVVGRET